MGDDCHSQSGCDHSSHRHQLRSTQDEFRFQMVRGQELANTDRERMLVMEKKKFLFRKLPPFDALSAREPVMLRHEEEKRFPPKRMSSEVRGRGGAGRDH